MKKSTRAKVVSIFKTTPNLFALTANTAIREFHELLHQLDIDHWLEPDGIGGFTLQVQLPCELVKRDGSGALHIE